ncbi:hypothetical protein HAX54_011963, partial [Datura stramonium]|nr:hypothetical protein [Datura stramonium]
IFIGPHPKSIHLIEIFHLPLNGLPPIKIGHTAALSARDDKGGSKALNNQLQKYDPPSLIIAHRGSKR